MDVLKKNNDFFWNVWSNAIFNWFVTGDKGGDRKIVEVDVDDLMEAVEKYGLRTEKNKKLRGRLWEQVTEYYNRGKAYDQMKTKTQLRNRYHNGLRKKDKTANQQAGLDFLNLD